MCINHTQIDGGGSCRNVSFCSVRFLLGNCLRPLKWSVWLTLNKTPRDDRKHGSLDGSKPSRNTLLAKGHVSSLSSGKRLCVAFCYVGTSPFLLNPFHPLKGFCVCHALYDNGEKKHHPSQGDKNSHNGVSIDQTPCSVKVYWQTIKVMSPKTRM